MPGPILVLAEHDRGTLAPATLEALTLARPLGGDVHALVIGAAAEPAAASLGEHGASVVHVADHDLLGDYGPETWGHSLAAAIESLAPELVIASGTDRRQRGARPRRGDPRPAVRRPTASASASGSTTVGR